MSGKDPTQFSKEDLDNAIEVILLLSKWRKDAEEKKCHPYTPIQILKMRIKYQEGVLELENQRPNY
jgi:hypothetical protein